MPTFRIKIYKNYCTITIPEPDYDVPLMVWEWFDYLPVVNSQKSIERINRSQIFQDNIKANEHFMRYIISKCWTKEQFQSIKELVKEFNDIQYKCLDYLDGLIDWDEVFQEKVIGELPDCVDLENDPVILELIELLDTAESDNRKLKQRKIKQIEKLQKELQELSKFN